MTYAYKKLIWKISELKIGLRIAIHFCFTLTNSGHLSTRNKIFSGGVFHDPRDSEVS